MNGKDLFYGIGGIDEDLIELAERKENSVTMSKKRDYKKIFIPIAACLALSLVIGFAAQPGNTTHELSGESTPVSETVPVHSGFTFLVASAAEKDENPVAINHGSKVNLPINGFIAVKDVGNLSDDAQSEAQEELFGSIQSRIDKTGPFLCTGNIVSGLAYYTVTNNKFVVVSENPDVLDSISIRCTQNGKLNTNNRITQFFESNDPQYFENANEIVLDREEYKEYCADTGVVINWGISDHAITEFAASENTTYESISDTITVTLNYLDGTAENFTINISFDSAGNMSACYNEIG